MPFLFSFLFFLESLFTVALPRVCITQPGICGGQGRPRGVKRIQSKYFPSPVRTAEERAYVGERRISMGVKKRFLKERVSKTNCGTACRKNRGRRKTTFSLRFQGRPPGTLAGGAWGPIRRKVIFLGLRIYQTKAQTDPSFCRYSGAV